MKERRTRTRVWSETILSLFAFALSIVTILWPDWIELSTPWNPDGGNSAVELGVVVALFALGLVLGLVARRDWRLALATRAPRSA